MKRYIALLLTLLLCLTACGGDSAEQTKQNETDDDTYTVETGLTAEEEPSDWRLLLVNPWNSVPEGYSVTLTQLPNGHAVDERIYPELQQMMDDMRAAGIEPMICSSYRTNDTQEYLYEQETIRYLKKGYTRADARREAANYVAVPGTSEHQLGLAVDILEKDYPVLDKSQEDTDTQKWLMEHSWEYGFILRYPNGKTNITGIIYEPWHYRYVGKETAETIYRQGVCLEEYLEELGAKYNNM